MFVLKQSDSYEWTVKVEFPVSGDKRQAQTFKAEFKRLSQSRIEEIQKLIQADQLTNKEFIQEIVVGWKDVMDENGQEISFSAPALDRLCDVQLVCGAMVTAFFASIAGAKAKN